MLLTDPAALAERLRELVKRATPTPWEWVPGHNQDGDSCETLSAQVGEAEPDEEPEYAEVLYGNSAFGDYQVSANWELIEFLANHASVIADALEDSARLDAAADNRICDGIGNLDIDEIWRALDATVPVRGGA